MSNNNDKSFQDYIRETDEFQQVAGQAQETASAVEDETAATVSEAVEPIVSLEKGDAEFWLRVVTVVLLFLIYKELARSNIAAQAGGTA